MGNQADAEDATQEAFLRAFKHAGKFDGRSRFSTWLYRLTLHHCLNKVQQRDRKRASEHRAAELLERAYDQSAASPLERIAHKEQSEFLDNVLEALPDKYRTCLVLREVGGMSYGEIAEILEIPVGTVMSRLSRAREQVRDRLLEMEQKGDRQRNKPGPRAVKTKEAGHDEMP